MPFRRSISSVLAEMRRSQENSGIFSPWSQPNPTASRNSASKEAPYTRSFLGTHPRITQVPPRPPVVAEEMAL